MRINGVACDDRKKPYVIAEASANHGGSLWGAISLVEAAAWAGADAIKFQTFTAESIAAANVSLPHGTNYADVEMWKRLGVKTLRDLFRNGGLPRVYHKEVKEAAESNGITFLSTPFSVDDAKFLVEKIGVPALKIASGSFAHIPLLEYASKTDLPIIISTGATTENEVIGIPYGILNHAYHEKRLAVLHCKSIYPCSPEDLELNSIPKMYGFMRKAVIGFSDHTISIDVVPVTAVTLGATMIEKHFRLESGPLTPDTAHSITASQLKQMIENIKDSIAARGSGDLGLHWKEKHDRLWARPSSRDWLRPTDEARAGRWD